MRLFIVGLGLIAGMGAASAQEANPTPPALDQVYACASVTGESERLACYDAAVGRLREAQSSGQIVAVDRAQAAALQRDAFGFSLPSLPRLFGGNAAQAMDVPEVTLEIERIAHSSDNHLLFVMTNGQAWQQIDNVSSPNMRAGVSVRLRRAAVGSFLMIAASGGAPVRVQRQR